MKTYPIHRDDSRTQPEIPPGRNRSLRKARGPFSGLIKKPGAGQTFGEIFSRSELELADTAKTILSREGFIIGNVILGNEIGKKL